jgi:serine/threonine protein kinase
LLDFGLSRMRSSAPLTAIGMVMGSPSYIPPETWRGNSALIDHRADLYSLAVIAFRMLAGRLPFETPSLIEKLKLVTSAERPSVCAFRPDLPAAVDDWMRRALAVEPDQRFQTAREFYDSLTLALNGAPFSLAEEELSGVRQKTSLASVLPSENRNVLSVAWERATSLLHRFIGQKAAQTAQAADAPIVPTPIVPITPLAPEGSEAAATPERVVPPTDHPSFAWLDDNDVEDLPPESVQGSAPSATPAAVPKKARARATPPGKKKKQASAPTAKKAKKPKARKAPKEASGAKKAKPKKSKRARKKP